MTGDPSGRHLSKNDVRCWLYRRLDIGLPKPSGESRKEGTFLPAVRGVFGRRYKRQNNLASVRFMSAMSRKAGSKSSVEPVISVTQAENSSWSGWDTSAKAVLISWYPGSPQSPPRHFLSSRRRKSQNWSRILPIPPRRAREAAFQALEIHGAHRCLSNSCLSAHSNLRDDEHGGSFTTGRGPPRRYRCSPRGVASRVSLVCNRLADQNAEDSRSGWTIRDTLRLSVKLNAMERGEFPPLDDATNVLRASQPSR